MSLGDSWLSDLVIVLCLLVLTTGDGPAVPGRSVGSADVAPGPGSGQPLYPLPHGAG